MTKETTKARQKGLVLLMGPSGSGKSTVERAVAERLGLTCISSYTDRPRRCPGETSHIFLTPEEFNRLECVVAYGEYDGHRYCTTREMIGNADIYVVEPEGVKEILDQFSGIRPIHVIGITVPDDVRKDHMEHRGDGAAAVSRRMSEDDELIAQMPLLCDVIVPNIDLAKTVDTVSSLIRMWQEEDMK